MYILISKIKQKIFKNNKMLKTVSAMTSGRMFNTFISIILVLIQSRFIGPEITGTVDSFSVPVGYLWILTFGVSSALARELPYYLSIGEKEKAMKMVQTTQSFSIVMGGGCAFVFFVLSIVSLFKGELLNAMGWGFQIIASFYTIYSSFLSTTYRTTDEFITIAKSNFITGITSIVMFPLIFLNPYLGLMSKTQISNMASNIYLYKKRPFKLKLGFDVSIFKKMVKFGLPLIIIGYFESFLWTSTQRSLILSLGGHTLLGYYGFINRILAAMLIIPNSVNDILRPRFASKYGETKGDVAKTLKIAIKPMAVTVLISLIAIALSSTLGSYLIKVFLPKYALALEALNISLIILPIIAIKTVKYMFVVCKNIKYNIISTIPGFVISFFLQYYFLISGFGISYLFLPYIIGQLTNLLVSLFLLYRLVKNQKRNEMKI